MKKIFKSLAIVAVAALGFACQNDINEQVNGNEGNTVTVEVVADAGTRSSFVEKDGDSYPSTWNADDKVVFYLNDAADGKTKNVEADGETAVFEVTFDDDGNTEGAIYAFAPKSISGAGGFGAKNIGSVNVIVPANQKPQAGSPDKAAHLLFGEKEYTDGIPANVNMEFNHVAAYGKMTIVMDEGVAAQNVSITFPVAVAGAACVYDYDNETWSGATEHTITLDDENVTDAYWFGIVPTGVMTSGKIVVEVVANNNHTYRKTITLSNEKKLGFEAGKVSNFTVNMTRDVQAYAERYVLVTNVNELAAGDKVVIAAAGDVNYAMSTTQNNNNRGQAAIEKVDNQLTINNKVQIFTLEAGTVDGTWAFNTGSGYIFAASSGSNYLRTENAKTDNSSWSVSIADGVASIVAQGSNTKNVMQYNQSSSLFACYGSASQKAVCIYKLGLTEVAKPKKAREMSFDVTEFEVVRGLESNFVKPELTFNGEGDVTYTSNSGNVTVEDGVVSFEEFTKNETVTITASIEANETYESGNAQYIIKLVVPTIKLSTVEAWDAVDTTSKTIEVTENTHEATITEVTGLTHFTASVVDNVITVEPQAANDDKEIKETMTVRFKVGDYTGSTTVTLTHGAPAVGGGVWTLVTDASSLNAGDQIVIAAANSNVAMSTTQNNNNRGQAAINKTDNIMDYTSAVQVFTLEAGTKSGTWAFYTGSGYIYAASSSANHLKTTGTKNDNASWTVTIANTGVATIKAQGTYTRNVMQYNSSNSLFSCYSSASQAAVVIYRLQ